MPKSYFKLENQTKLSDLKKGARIHFIGVAGVAMGNLAIALSSKYQVSGSDKEFYEPMGSLLKDSKIKLYKGYSEKNLEDTPDLVVIGNAISYEHPEVLVVEENKIAYTSFSSLLYDFIIKGKTSIVACGTHGKTTTSAITSFIAKELNLNPSYFIGGKVAGFQKSLVKDNGILSIVEGDEYDDVFYSKQSKFMHYKPDICIINAMEFDHADLYSDFNAIKKTFYNLAVSLKEDAFLIYNHDSPELNAAIKEWKKNFKCKILSFGEDQNSTLSLKSREVFEFTQKVTISLEGRDYSFNLNIPGIYNVKNVMASIFALSKAGVDLMDSTKAVENFSGVSRRQENHYNKNGILVIEDFAHHPTAIKLAINSMREAYPNKKIISVFEPRSNTSRLKVFYDDYLEAFKNSDISILQAPELKANLEQADLLDVSQLAKELTEKGHKTFSFKELDEIKDYILKEINENCLVLIMSNGSFGGLLGSLLNVL